MNVNNIFVEDRAFSPMQASSPATNSNAVGKDYQQRR